MDTTAYYALITPAFLLLVGLEALVAHWRGRPVLTFAVSFGNLSAGLGALFVGLFIGPALYFLYEWAWQTFALFQWPPNSVWTWAAGLLLADLAHYGQHRVDHKVAPLWAMHAVHHQGTEVNLTLSMRHTWGSDFYSFPFYAALPLLGIPPTVFFVSTVIMSVHAMATHSSELRFPSFGFLVTPQSHRLHHAKNACYIDRNYGGMFSIWDKIFGTHVIERADTPPVFGIERGYSTHDGALCQWHQLRDFWRPWRHLAGSHARIKALVTPPGPALQASEPWAQPPPSAAIALSTKVYASAQFTLATVMAMYVLNWRDQHGWVLKITTAVFVLCTLLCLGGLLDQRPRAWRKEGWRVMLAPPALAAAIWWNLAV
jgi:alkylglycerol monooxygenase